MLSVSVMINYDLIKQDVCRCMGTSTFGEAAALRIALKLLNVGRKKAALQILQSYERKKHH